MKSHSFAALNVGGEWSSRPGRSAYGETTTGTQGGPCGCFRLEKNALPMPVVRVADCPTHGLVTVMTMLSRPPLCLLEPDFPIFHVLWNREVHSDVYSSLPLCPPSSAR